MSRRTMLGDALASVATSIACDVRDWSGDRRSAWLYGILVGWGEALPEVARQYRWDAATVARLRRLRAAVAKSTASAQPINVRLPGETKAESAARARREGR